MRIEYHRTLLADRVRNAAYHAALRRVVVPGKSTVADIGSGTGFLGFLAAKLGAKRVDLYERAVIAAVARELGRHNRIRNCQLIPVHSTDIIDPERVDLVVTETLGNYPFEENIIETLNDARARFLTPGGRIIPAGLEQFACPVIGARLFRELASWDDVGYGLDFAPAKKLTMNNIYVRWLEVDDLLDGGRAAQSWDKVRFDRRNKTTRSGELAWPLGRATIIYGLALWWCAELVAGVCLSTSPLHARSHWEQLYLPALDPIEIKAGETLRARLRSTTSYEHGTNLRWTLVVEDAKGRERLRHALDLEKGFLP
jgi:type I protein arginine methyltransferase